MIRVPLEQLIDIERLRIAGCQLDQPCVADSAAPFVLTQIANPFGEIHRKGSITYVSLPLRLTFRKRLHFSKFGLELLRDGARFTWTRACEEHSPSYCVPRANQPHVGHSADKVLNSTLSKPGILNAGISLEGFLVLQAESEHFQCHSQVLGRLVCTEISGAVWKYPLRLRLAQAEIEESDDSTLQGRPNCLAEI